MTDPTRLVDVTRQVLDLAAAILTDAGYAPPDRRYIASGRVVAMPGCESLAVVVERVYPGLPGQEQRTVPNTCAHPLSAQLAVVLNRCVPTVKDSGHLPEAAELDAAGVALTDQGWLLLLGMQAALGVRPGDGQVVGLAGPLESVRPDGGLGGWRLAMNVRV